MDADSSGNGPGASRDASLGWRAMAAIALLVFAAHAAIACLAPLPGAFRKYPGAARQLLSGEMARERLIDFSPLYLELNRLGLYLEPLLGPLETFLPWLQIALLAWAVAAAAAVASRHLGRRAAFAFAALLALDRHVAAYVRILEPEIVLLALLATWLFFLDRDGARPAPRELLLAGGAAALAIATRPTFLPVFLAVVPLFLAFRLGFRRPLSGAAQPWRPWLRATAFFLLPLAAAAALLAARAAAATGDFRSPAMNPGTVLYEGHQPLSTGTSARYPPAVHLAVRSDPDTEPDVAHVVYRRFARAESGDPALPIAAVNDFWAGRAFAFMADQPLLAARRAVKQLRYALHAHLFHDVSQATLLQQRLGPFFVPFSLLSAFALWGAASAAHRFRRLLLFYAILAAQLGVMTLFYVSARQRMVLLPALVLFALYGLRDLAGRGRRGLALGLLLLGLGLALAVRDPAQHEDLYLRHGFSAALQRRDEVTSQLKAGATVAALREEVCAGIAEMPSRLEDVRPAGYPQDQESLESCVARRLRQRLAAAREWERPSLEFDLAGVELLLGRLDQAEALLRPLAGAGPGFPRDGSDPSRPEQLLARIAFLRGDAAAAREWLRAALAAAPGEPFVLADLWALTGEDSYRRQLLRYYSRFDQAWIAGRALLFYRQPEAAAAELASLAERMPKARRPRLELAIALGELGRDAEALAQLQIAYQGPGEPCAQASRLLPLLERLASRAATARDRVAVGVLLFHHGAYRRAAELLGPALLELGPAAAPELRRMLEAARTA